MLSQVSEAEERRLAQKEDEYSRMVYIAGAEERRLRAIQEAEEAAQRAIDEAQRILLEKMHNLSPTVMQPLSAWANGPALEAKAIRDCFTCFAQPVLDAHTRAEFWERYPFFRFTAYALQAIVCVHLNQPSSCS